MQAIDKQTLHDLVDRLTPDQIPVAPDLKELQGSLAGKAVCASATTALFFRSPAILRFVECAKHRSEAYR